ncbi:MAG: pseudouridine-5'-phosphate glycosidase [Candidatus Eremiobacteraeota bacterium]|nr:pseudouridine-5'-phosphate glycosidase [Candidatus Eremiobacteraeota bacterium]
MKGTVLEVDPRVRSALDAGEPIVALESTIVAHGMPFPQNLETARNLEAIVRARGATPATIAVLDGQIRIGLDDASLERLARATNVRKLSRADLAYAVARGENGATTVAATMYCAHLAGIAVFATGGIGGVHRGAETTFDVSADLYELARTDVTVVCAGAKALLDVPKTLELLETLGVPVLCFQSDEFPAFWSRSSGLAAPLRVDGVPEIAAVVAARRALNVSGGVLVANPVPADAEIPSAEMEPLIAQALADARDAGIVGKRVTPFLLGRILTLSDGRSLRTNVALAEANARLAAELARALCEGRA